MTQVTMIGSGYVGLVSAACFADLGHDVSCVDKDPARTAVLKTGAVPIYEPGLADMMARNVREGRLSFTDDLGEVLPQAQVAIIAVGTPQQPGGDHADITQLREASEEIAQHITSNAVVVTKSTVPVGTCDDIEHIIRERRPGRSRSRNALPTSGQGRIQERSQRNVEKG